ncbi:PHP domain-containing protein, partial [Bremerella sp. JC817]|uniref:PHP domain-containing protein n=1 Tax=Bremerella sp. JC817 TaxID=3231756 RepID=UPI003457D14C
CRSAISARAVRRTHRGADLHVHTTHSDGSCTPGDVVRAAATVGLSALSITDHDTLSAFAVARPEAQRLGIELIPGIELSASDGTREVHILGHFIDPDDPDLRATADALRHDRQTRL